MAIAGRILGTEASLWISTDGGSNYTEIEHVNSISESFSTDIVENTSNDDAGYKSNLAGNKQQTLDVDCFYYYGPGQIAVRTSARSGALVHWKYHPTTNVGDPELLFQARISEKSGESPNNDNTSFAFSIESSGSVTEQAQS